MILYIKNMVCNRCVYVVQSLVDKMKLNTLSIQLGELKLKEEKLTQHQLQLLRKELEAHGFELLDTKSSQLIEKIKLSILQYVEECLEDIKRLNLSDYLEKELGFDYNYISNLFSLTAGTTIEHYFINLKIERVKELLLYDELTLNEIAFQMGYSSVAHLSKQFKKETGLTPGYFRKLKDSKKRFPLDEL
ncbi:MAG: helix-turn-helix transcriptional regulator [Flavobacteriales bacterium]|nr:helix-turn-helix transcriptional regulator [Flavobacteriales bacterium]MCB9334718.1 helix-turn-helix transcriptional regulator [Flavobacteriales bacterium]